MQDQKRFAIQNIENLKKIEGNYLSADWVTEGAFS